MSVKLRRIELDEVVKSRYSRNRKKIGKVALELRLLSLKAGAWTWT
jgi:hypothetical protein